MAYLRALVGPLIEHICTDQQDTPLFFHAPEHDFVIWSRIRYVRFFLFVD